MFGSEPVRRNDHVRPGDHIRRRVAVTADARVQDARELTRWVVAVGHAPRLPPPAAPHARGGHDHENGTTIPILMLLSADLGSASAESPVKSLKASASRPHRCEPSSPLLCARP